MFLTANGRVATLFHQNWWSTSRIIRGRT